MISPMRALHHHDAVGREIVVGQCFIGFLELGLLVGFCIVALTTLMPSRCSG